MKGFNYFYLAIGLLLTWMQPIMAQEEPFGPNFIFELQKLERQTMVSQPYVVDISDTAVYRIFDQLKENPSDRIISSTPKSPLLLGVKLNPELKKYFSASITVFTKEYPVYLIGDSSDAVLIAMGISAQNSHDYHYRVVENDSMEIIKWSPIPRLEQAYGAKKPYAFMGKYNYPGKKIMVELAHKEKYGLRDGVVFDWRTSYQPVLEQIIVSTKNTYFNLNYQHVNKGYATRFDQRTGWPEDFRFPVDSVRRLLFQFKRQETLAHSVELIRSTEDKTDTLSVGFVDRYGYVELIRQYYNTPGHYELIVQKQNRVLQWDEPNLVRIPFEVLPTPVMDKKYGLKDGLPYFIGLLLLFLIGLLIYRLYHKRMLDQAHRQRMQLQFQLKSIRAQLNPHFIFNALGSIQNLMNKNKLLEANHYLSKFAGLTRKVLQSSDEEMISLREELKIAEDYLQMEQLRFGFHYRIEVDQTLDLEHIDIPAMLLQPFIENAVKHGVSKLKDEGMILVGILAQGHHLVLTIKDNGKGFNVQERPTGDKAFGLKLSKDRLHLLTQMHPLQPATVTIDTDGTGTLVTIIIKDWI